MIHQEISALNMAPMSGEILIKNLIETTLKTIKCQSNRIIPFMQGSLAYAAGQEVSIAIIA
jgi:hypothetical protein